MASYKTSPWQWTSTASSTAITYTVEYQNWTATNISSGPWNWITTNSSSTYPGFTSAPVIWHQIEESLEEQAARIERERQRRAELDAAAAQQAKENRLAQLRAEALLLENLDETEIERWKAKGEIHVRSQRGRRYCIRGDKRQHNIFELGPDDVPVKELCVHIDAACPLADNVLAQKLALEHAEDHLLEKANTWDLVGGRRAR